MAYAPGDELANRLRIAVRSSSVGDSPGIAYAAAQQQQPDKAAQAAAGFRWAYQNAQTLRTLDEDLQRKTWGAFNNDERNLLSGIGYSPPEDKGILHRLGHVLTHPYEVVTRPVGKLLSGAGAGLRGVQHAYRATDYAFATNPVNPIDWARGWSMTSDGEKYLPNADKALAASGLPVEHGAIARDFAAGVPLEQLIASYGADSVAAATNDPNWNKALDYLNRSKSSPGRDLARLFPGNHGKVGTLLSGVGDAVFDIFGDPVNQGLNVVGDLNKTRYLIRGREDVARVWDSPGVQRAVGRISQNLQTRGAAGVIDEFPKLRPIAQDLAKTDASPEAIRGVFELHAGLQGGIEGRGVGFFREAPTLGPLGEAKLDVRLRIKDYIDRRAQNLAIPTGTAASARSGLGRFVKGMTTLFEKTGGIDLTEANSSKIFKQIADLAIPRQDYISEGITKAGRDSYINAYIAGDLGTRHNVYVSMLNDVFHALGSDWEQGLEPATELAGYHRAVVGAAGGLDASRPYGLDFAGKVNSLVDTPSGTKSLGIRESQFTTAVAIPDVQRLANAARAERLIGPLGEGWLPHYMKFWKASMLARFGFPLRVGGEEAFRFVLDAGLMPYIKSKGAKLALAGERAGYQAMAAEYGIPAGSQSYAAFENSIAQTHEWLANRALYAAGKAGKALSGEWYVAAARLQLEQHGADALPEGIAAGHIVQDYTNTSHGIVAAIKDAKTGKVTKFNMKVQGWEADLASAEHWQNQLLKISKDPTTKAALEHAGNLDEATRAVEDLMRSDAWAKYRKQSAMLNALQETGLSEDQAIADLARRNAEDTFALTHTPSGDPHSFVDAYRNGQTPDLEHLDSVLPADRPLRVATEKLVPVPLNKGQLLADWFFRRSDRIINSISREPFYTHELATALARIEPEVQKLIPAVGEKAARKLAGDWAQRAAFDAVKPFIHNPEIRNVFEQYHMATLPFWFAKEQFYRRWATTLVTNPVVVRRAQLGMMGLRHSGLVHTDENGQDYFFLPTLPFMGEAIGGVASLVTGVPAKFPVDIPMTGQVKYLSAASEGPQPGLGPFVGLGLGLLSRRFPELFGKPTNEIETELLGERASGKPLWQNFTPTIVNNVYNSILGKEDESAQVASAISHTILQLHAVGLDPGPDASPEQQQAFLHRVSVWTRGNLLMRAMFGFISPTTPQLDIPADNVRPELLKLMKELPFEQALATFMKLHPDKGYLAVFSTKALEGASQPLPVTEHAGRWLADNRKFINDYGASAASYFLPDAPEGFDQATWQQELAIGLRVRKTGSQYWRDLQIASDKSYYYDSQSRYYALRANLTGSARSQLDQRWAILKSQYLESRPLLRQFIQEGGDRQQSRSAVLESLVRAGVDGRVPDAASALLLEGYQKYFYATQALAGRRDGEASDLRRAYAESLRGWAQRFSGPARGIYTQLIEPDLPHYEVV